MLLFISLHDISSAGTDILQACFPPYALHGYRLLPSAVVGYASAGYFVLCLLILKVVVQGFLPFLLFDSFCYHNCYSCRHLFLVIFILPAFAVHLRSNIRCISLIYRVGFMKLLKYSIINVLFWDNLLWETLTCKVWSVL